ncbi:MAG: hypothetical protein GY820_24425, partial [Gammaproteobacteria bacterium]|nr:hypothetical protein [Gammaproteobacteria bacterium]
QPANSNQPTQGDPFRQGGHQSRFEDQSHLLAGSQAPRSVSAKAGHVSTGGQPSANKQPMYSTPNRQSGQQAVSQVSTAPKTVNFGTAGGGKQPHCFYCSLPHKSHLCAAKFRQNHRDQRGKSGQSDQRIMDKLDSIAQVVQSMAQSVQNLNERVDKIENGLSEPQQGFCGGRSNNGPVDKLDMLMNKLEAVQSNQDQMNQRLDQMDVHNQQAKDQMDNMRRDLLSQLNSPLDCMSDSISVEKSPSWSAQNQHQTLEIAHEVTQKGTAVEGSLSRVDCEILESSAEMECIARQLLESEKTTDKFRRSALSKHASVGRLENASACMKKVSGQAKNVPTKGISDPESPQSVVEPNSEVEVPELEPQGSMGLGQKWEEGNKRGVRMKKPNENLSDLSERELSRDVCLEKRSSVTKLGMTNTKPWVRIKKGRKRNIFIFISS